MPDEDEENAAVTQLYGEPFDSGFALAEEHQLAADPGAACAVYEELLTVAESIEDSPDVRFLRAHLLSDIASVRLTATDLVGAEEAVERSRGLLDGTASVPMGPRGRQLWLEILLKTLLARADLLRRTGRLDEALGCLDEAAVRLPEFDDPEALRTAELGLNRVHLLMDRGEWGSAEEQGLMLLSTLPETLMETVPRLLTALGLICASTGRFDPAEDYFARAEDGFRAMEDTGELQSLVAHRAYAAMHRGDLDLAERLFAEASAVFERQGRFGDLAVCEQARGFLAGRRGDTIDADDLLGASLARFERLGASIAAADTMLLGAQHAYDRGDIEAMKRLAHEAREVYQAREVYERCAQVDLMLAKTLEHNLNLTHHGDHETESIGTALSLALPAALALEAARYDFVTAHARSQWLELADEAMRLVFRLAVRRQDQGLLFELVEHRCAGVSLALDRTPLPATRPSPPESAEAAESVFPSAAMKAYGHVYGPMTLGGVAAEAAASAGLRVAPPPKVRMSPESGRVALQEYIEAAEFRYHRPIVNEEEVPFWITDDLTSRPVVQVRLADAGDLFMTWTWAGGARGFGTGRGPGDEVDRAVGALAAALPGAGGGAEGVRRAFDSGAMADQRTEHRLARMLAEALWPEGLTAQIRQVSARAGRPLIRIQPSSRVAQVPWELLAVDGDVRLIDLADVVTTVPVSLQRQDPAARPAPDADTDADTVVLVLDPRVPGFRADSSLGSVLGPPGSDPEVLSFVRSRLDTGAVVPSVATPAEAFRRSDLDRDWLSEVLRKGARRLMYVGHVSGAPVEGGQSEDGTLHLCCGPGTDGLAEPIRTHRPLSAKDLLLGTLPLRADGEPGARIWPAPPRVALIGCESGGDLRFAESFGLATAMIHNGAELVTATRWVLPTSFAFHRLAGLAESVRPLSEAIIAVDAAHEHRDPVHRLGRWQREQLDHWRAGGRIEHSPLLWAAMTCIVV
ncbi:CHAT domain-containing protein [Streptomyces sp. Ncost-T10-10d]|uniref:CHAT domain-containing protein n=1 Tax=Streptomyces sp. Ncost-T10-10d TaxID=1839774 RepID=UPI00081E9A9A|nr:CHAT domain-containing protein [Streptomyces sp. Ncost-T10-10d]SCF83160.1 CHAT domain-containing protein [Streptomyces sp. Ncost-T10-10d]